ncbi:hypothetical protein J6590_038987 [Homalodisca vitripennis]|nr:hypothetical protein J6590_038987 [Homalodisca vitripennis]
MFKAIDTAEIVSHAQVYLTIAMTTNQCQRTDLVVAPLTMTSEREEVVDVVAIYFENLEISIGIVTPALIKYKRNA